MKVPVMRPDLPDSANSAPPEPASSSSGAAPGARAPSDGGEVDLARRKLVTQGAYVAPAVLAMVAFKAAMAPPPSCTPQGCTPVTCGPAPR